MSRSKKGGKGPGYEYWSTRPGSSSPGAFAKKQCHHIERRQGKKEALKNVDQKE